MFDSGISVKNLIDELKNTEVDIALEIPNITYVTWLNALQQILYTEIIKEQKKRVFKPPFNMEEGISLEAENNENKPSFEDIHTVYADDTQLIKSTVTSGMIFPNTYYKNNENLYFNTKEQPTELTVVYYVKPKLVKTDEEDEIGEGNVMIPIEFIDLVKAKLRGEAYKLANEDNIAAKWLNDYNNLLETFKVWIASKSSTFGM